MSLIGAPPGLRTSIGLVTLGSDETLLREIDTRVLEWSKKSGLALSNGEIDDYRLHKIQVRFLTKFLLIPIPPLDFCAPRMASTNYF
jgi:hypothetical protein